VSPVRYEGFFYIREDDILYSPCRENLKILHIETYDDYFFELCFGCKLLLTFLARRFLSP
jgi:hypothetical protein